MLKLKEKVTDEKNPVSESVRNSKNQLSLPGQWEEMPWLKSAYPGGKGPVIFAAKSSQ